jgi:lactoylglutathione lyase
MVTREPLSMAHTLTELCCLQEDNCVFELTYNWGQDDPYDRGNAYAQVAISTDDVYKTAQVVEANGGNVSRAPGPLPGIGTKIMATTDPDGWKVVFVDDADFLAELK